MERYCARKLPVQCLAMVNRQLFLNNLYNVVSIKLGQHCIGTLHTQGCLNKSEATSHKNIICAMLDQSAQIYFHRQIGCFKYVWWPAFLPGHNITEQSLLFLFNAGSGVHLRLAGQQWTGTDIDLDGMFILFKGQIYSKQGIPISFCLGHGLTLVLFPHVWMKPKFLLLTLT